MLQTKDVTCHREVLYSYEQEEEEEKEKKVARKKNEMENSIAIDGVVRRKKFEVKKKKEKK